MVKNWLIYGLVLLLTILFIYTTNSKMAYVTLYSFLILPLLSWVIAFVSRYFFEFTEHIDSDFIVKGDDVNYKVVLDNKSIFSYSHVSVVFKQDLKNSTKIETDIGSKSFGINGRRKYVINFKIKCLYRGVFEIGADYIEFKDMLGLIKFKFRIDKKLSILVYPQIIELNNFSVPLLRLSKMSSNIQIGEEDYSQVSDIRKHQDQDGFKKIHWKLSAKKNELLVKSYQSTIVNNVTVFVDLKRCLSAEDEASVEDQLVESAVAIVNYCLNKQIPVHFNYYSDGHKNQVANSMEDFKNIYSVCATLASNDDDIMRRVFSDFISLENDSSNIILFESALDDAIAEELIRAKKIGHNVILVFAYDNISARHYSLLNDIKNIGVTTFLMPKNTNINHVY